MAIVGIILCLLGSVVLGFVLPKVVMFSTQPLEFWLIDIRGNGIADV